MRLQDRDRAWRRKRHWRSAYSDEQVRELVRTLCGDDTYLNFQDEAHVGPNTMLTEDEV